MEHLFRVAMPALAAGLSALSAIRLLASRRSKEDLERVEHLALGFPGNVVTDMGIALHRVARMLGEDELADPTRLADRLRRRELPRPTLEAWDAFLARFGWRGPHEMDLASPRYRDDPGLAVEQMAGMAGASEALDPERALERRVEERRRAYAELRASWFWRRPLLDHFYGILDRFASARDTPKHHNLLFYAAVRERVLAEGRRLAEEDRLDAAEDVSGLRFEDLEAAGRDPELDLRAIRRERMGFVDELEARVTSFPAVIDSRGRIPRPAPREELPGQLTGTAISPGAAIGPVKVLHHPHEKPVLPGEVLVAYTTDPGWTPLFVNAAAVVLEVGGVLQHGAVVAREYGKPCVAGIDRVVAKLEDGQRVEVNGTTGVVHLLDAPAETRIGDPAEGSRGGASA